MDERFWRETLGLSAAELEEIKKSVPLHNDLSTKGIEEFETWFYADFLVRIQEWHGGYKHVDMRGPIKSQTLESYPGHSLNSGLWNCWLPQRAEDRSILPASVTLSVEESFICLYAQGSRFGVFDDPERRVIPKAKQNVFLKVPLVEGRALAAWRKPDYKIEIWPGVCADVVPWVRCYQNVDLEKGLAWQLWIDDCELSARAEGSPSQAELHLIEDYRRLVYDRFTDKADRTFIRGWPTLLAHSEN